MMITALWHHQVSCKRTCTNCNCLQYKRMKDMAKILLFGGVLIISGTIGLGLLCAGAMASDIFLNGSREIWSIFHFYGVDMYAIASLIEICVGIALSIVGLAGKKEKSVSE